MTQPWPTPKREFPPPVFTWTGWHTGDDCTPEEPGKEWLAIEEDGEEFAIIVLRTSAFETEATDARLNEARAAREVRAFNIVRALNNLVKEGDYA